MWPGAADDLEAGAGDAFGGLANEVRRRGAVLRARDDERRQGQARGAVAQVGLGERGGAADIARDGRAGEHVAPASQLVGALGVEAFREPAGEGRVGQRLDAAGADGGDAFGPDVGRADLGGGVGEDQRADEVGTLCGETLGHHAADGEADEGGASDAEMVEQRGGVGHEVAHPVIAFGRVGQAVAAHVVADDPRARRQMRQERVPDAQVGAEGIGEDERRPVRIAALVEVDADAVERGHPHARQAFFAPKRSDMKSTISGTSLSPRPSATARPSACLAAGEMMLTTPAWSAINE